MENPSPALQAAKWEIRSSFIESSTYTKYTYTVYSNLFAVGGVTPLSAGLGNRHGKPNKCH